MFRNTETLKAGNFDIPEMYVSYIAPLGKGLRFDAGKFATHLGSEVIGGYDGYNDEFSRSASCSASAFPLPIPARKSLTRSTTLSPLCFW